MNGRIGFLAGLSVGLTIALATPARAQTRIAGRVLEAESNSPIAGAVVYAPGSAGHTLSDASGGFSLKTRAIPVVLVAVRLGFRPDSLRLTAADNVVFRLASAPLVIDPVLIATERASSVGSSSVLRDLDIRLRPRDSSQRLLSLTPGLVIAQHAGGGKAEQIFLRGFDADHGTDVAVAVDGLPVNMVSHAHGQGYADLHFLMPEVVERVETRKGAYDVRDGDFATAGAVQFRTRDRVESPSLIARAGSFGQRQAVVHMPFGSLTGSGGFLAAGRQTSDGPFEASQNHARNNLFLKWTTPLADHHLAVSASGFSASWDASGQLPQRAVNAGVIGRFGAIDPTEGGTTSRYDVLAKLSGSTGNGLRWEASAHATRYRFRLFSNFTFFANDSINGDGIEQVDDRTLFGGRAELTGTRSLLGLPGVWSAGASTRSDFADVALHSQVARTRLDTRTSDHIAQTQLASWLQQELQLGAATRVTFGLRADVFRFDVTDRLEAADNGLPHGSAVRWVGLVSPRANLTTSLGDGTALFASGGFGFHSNDARDVVRAANGERILPRARSVELGTRRSWQRGSVGLAAWLIDLESELVFVGDEGSTEPSGATRRVGIDAEARIGILPWLWADADLNLSHGRFRTAPGGEDRIPLAPTLTSTGGLVARSTSPIAGGIRYRLIGARAADESNTVRARQAHVWEAFASWERGPLHIGLAVDNLFDVAWNEAQFATTSRLRQEPEPVSELHFTPGAPRSLILSAGIRF